MAQDVKFVKKLGILDRKDALFHITEMWRMAQFFCHNCGEHRITVGHPCFRVSMDSAKVCPNSLK